ncbi:MAG: WYL domain-containing protein, partial [Sphaerospermopsis sp.]|nr:WYL domain-containing protein [Sphaerospermopsis sp.]
WYVLAARPEGGTTAMFAISRIRRVERIGEKVKRPEGFDPDEYMHEAFGIVRGGKPFGVRLAFSPAVASYIRERVWHRGQKMRALKDGWLEVSFETAGWKELVRWILSWQPDVRVLSPKVLRERIREKLELAVRGQEAGGRRQGAGGRGQGEVNNPITNHQSPITNHPSPVTCHFLTSWKQFLFILCAVLGDSNCSE